MFHPTADHQQLCIELQTSWSGGLKLAFIHSLQQFCYPQILFEHMYIQMDCHRMHTSCTAKYQQQISRPISVHSSIYAGTIIQFWIFKSCSLGVTGQAIKLCTSRWYLHSRVSLGIMNVCTRQLHWASKVDVAKRDVHRQDNLGGARVGPSKGQISFPITRHPEGTFSGAFFR